MLFFYVKLFSQICTMDWLLQCTSEFTSVVDNNSFDSDYVQLDLSLKNSDLERVDVSSPQEIQQYINKLYKKSGSTTAYGGYLEKRGIYRRSQYFNDSNPETERNIHLGMDIWCNAGTEVIAPMDGRIHSFKNNTNFGDYGPTIILEHNLNGKQFYSLYGHLSLESIEGLVKDSIIKKGQIFCRLGEEAINGNYAPHLHFQIILDLQGHEGDYPGVCSSSELEFYKNNCPDPNLILKISNARRS